LLGGRPEQPALPPPLCADSDGFSLHAAVRCGADDGQALEQLCRYTAGPALAGERVQTNSAGQLTPKLRTQWLDGTTHPVMLPLAFMQRPAALVACPRPAISSLRSWPLKASYREPNHAACGTALGRQRILAEAIKPTMYLTVEAHRT